MYHSRSKKHHWPVLCLITAVVECCWWHYVQYGGVLTWPRYENKWWHSFWEVMMLVGTSSTSWCTYEKFKKYILHPDIRYWQWIINLIGLPLIPSLCECCKTSFGKIHSCGILSKLNAEVENLFSGEFQADFFLITKCKGCCTE